MCHRNTLNKLFELRGEGEGERVKGPRVIRSQGANSAIFRHTLERAFNTTSKGATGKPRVLPNSDILAIPHNPAHSLTKQLNPMSKGGPNVRSTRPPGAVKYRGVREIFSFQNASPHRVRVSVQAPGLVHEDRLISVTDGCQAQATSLFGHSQSFPTHRVAAPMVSSVPPEEAAAHFVQLVAGLLGDKGGLHGIYGNGGYHKFNEGGSSRHG